MRTKTAVDISSYYTKNLEGVLPPRSSRSFPPPLPVLAAGAPAEPSRETLSDSVPRGETGGGGGEEGATEGGGRGAQPERGCWRLHLLEGGFSAAW